MRISLSVPVTIKFSFSWIKLRNFLKTSITVATLFGSRVFFSSHFANCESIWGVKTEERAGILSAKFSFRKLTKSRKSLLSRFSAVREILNDLRKAIKLASKLDNKSILFPPYLSKNNNNKLVKREMIYLGRC